MNQRCKDCSGEIQSVEDSMISAEGCGRDMPLAIENSEFQMNFKLYSDDKSKSLVQTNKFFLNIYQKCTNRFFVFFFNVLDFLTLKL